jgi:phytoene dehydrogenase-like protein
MFARWVANAIPVRAACLDVALDRLPRPQQRFALGLDRPLYFSVHSAAANLAPAGITVLHVMKYSGNETTPIEDVQGELEAYLERLQPGWKEHVAARRFLPNMTVAHAMPLAVEDGLAGRPAVSIPGRPRVFLAGDWVGPRGWLADASAASAEEAATRALAALASTPDRTERRLTHAGI